MSVNILIQDLFLDFTFDSNMNLERRFFVEIEIDAKNKEVLTFFSEMNSAFEKYGRLDNKVILDNKDLLKEFNEKREERETEQFNQEFIILEKSKIYTSLTKVVVSTLESLDEDVWLSYCEKRYIARGKVFTEENKLRELNKLKKSNEMIKQLWKNFPNNIDSFTYGGEFEKIEKIPQKFANFMTEVQFLYMKEKFVNKDITEKKPKI